jgi:hypothetical protein
MRSNTGSWSKDLQKKLNSGLIRILAGGAPTTGGGYGFWAERTDCVEMRRQTAEKETIR